MKAQPLPNEPLIVARLTGRCANGAERDGGRRTHLVPLSARAWGAAICGAKPGRLSNGWDEIDGAEVPTCPRCYRRATAPTRVELPRPQATGFARIWKTLADDFDGGQR